MQRRRRRRNNIITSMVLICAIIMMAVLPLPIAEAASFTVSKSNVSLKVGENSTITISAPTHTGKIDIISSNSTVATVSDSSLWIENDSKTITIIAEEVGTATITIKGELYDSSTDEEKEFSDKISVTVSKASGSISSITDNSSSGKDLINSSSEEKNTMSEAVENSELEGTSIEQIEGNFKLVIIAGIGVIIALVTGIGIFISNKI